MKLILFFSFLCTLVFTVRLDVENDYSDYTWDTDEISPFTSAMVITPDQAYNTNQNFMYLHYFSTYDYERDMKRLYVIMELHLEKPDVNQDIYMYFST